MQTFENYNPIALTVYFLSAAGLAMLCMNPVILLLSLCGAVAQNLGSTTKKTHLFFLGVFLLSALINPIVSHNGVTVLFVVNHSPITLEATLYGITAAMMIVSVMYRFAAFSRIMTSDKLLYVFGALSPKLSLVLSMALRYVSLFTAQAKKINLAQKALGLYKEDNIIDLLRAKARVFSVLITWALENGIITADSMSARGYGATKRTRFSRFRFTAADILLILCSASVVILLCIFLANGTLQYSFYPELLFPAVTFPAMVCYVLYGTLSFLPAVLKGVEKIRWNYLMSKI